MAAIGSNYTHTFGANSAFAPISPAPAYRCAAEEDIFPDNLSDVSAEEDFGSSFETEESKGSKGSKRSKESIKKVRTLSVEDKARYTQALERVIEEQALSSSTSGVSEQEKLVSRKKIVRRIITGNKAAITVGATSLITATALLVEHLGIQTFANFFLTPGVLAYRYLDLGVALRTSIKHPSDYIAHYSTISKASFAANATINFVKNTARLSGVALKAGVLGALSTTFSALSGFLLVGSIAQLGLENQIIDEINRAKNKKEMLEVINAHPRLFSRELFETLRLTQTDTKCDLYQRLDSLLENDFDNTKNYILKKMQLIHTGTRIDVISSAFFAVAPLGAVVNPLAPIALSAIGVTAIIIKEGVVLPLMKTSVESAREKLLDNHLNRITTKP